MPELETMTVKGFKSLAAVEQLSLQAINLLIGPNGSGKSNFMEVFSFLHALQEGRLQDYVLRSGGADKILHFGSRASRQMEMHISFQGGMNQYRIILQPDAAGQLQPCSECLYFWDKGRDQQPDETLLPARGLEAGISDPEGPGVAACIGRHLERWRLYHFHDTRPASPMRLPADINDNRHLRPDSANLATFLYFLRQAHRTSYALIRGSGRRVAPFFDDFHLAPMRLNDSMIRLEWMHKNSGAFLDASSLSDGTLRFIGLATLFLQPEEHRPSIILVDEPELGLHPCAISMLASLIKQCSRQTQVIVSTQSSHLLDHFQPEDVLAADRLRGGTVLTRLESGGLEPWLQDYSLGQLWEKNVIGGRPAA